jgi:hypothetical protein
MAKSFNPSDTILNKAGVNDHPQSGWLGFPAVGRKNKRTPVRNHCVCDRVRSTRSQTTTRFGKPNQARKSSLEGALESWAERRF